MTAQRFRQLLTTLSVACCLIFGLPIATCAQTAYFQHTVEAQETLYGIARKFGVSIDELLAANPGVTAQNLRRGQVIRIPTSATAATTPTPAAPWGAYW